jgi:DNA-binding CsgD family transcriptional regulator
MAKRIPQKPAEPSKNAGKALRNSAIVAAKLSGKSNVKIASELGIDRETVAKVLKSGEFQRLTQEIDLALSKGIERAIKRVVKVAGNDTAAAIQLLRNFGSMRSRIELTGKNGAPLSGLSEEQLDMRLKALLEAVKEKK